MVCDEDPRFCVRNGEGRGRLPMKRNVKATNDYCLEERVVMYCKESGRLLQRVWVFVL